MSFATEQVELLRAAYRAVLNGQSYRIMDRTVTRADAKWISDELDKWERRARREAAGRRAGPAIADFSGCGR